MAADLSDLSSEGMPARPRQSFLRKGRGIEARVAATQTRKYVPKGGFLKTVEQHLPKVSKLKQIRLARGLPEDAPIKGKANMLRAGVTAVGSPRTPHTAGAAARLHKTHALSKPQTASDSAAQPRTAEARSRSKDHSHLSATRVGNEGSAVDQAQTTAALNPPPEVRSRPYVGDHAAGFCCALQTASALTTQH